MENNPVIILSKEFMVNNTSNPLVISSLIKLQLEKVYNMFNSETSNDHFILIKYTELTASN